MKCPFCTKEFNPSEAMMEDDWRNILKLLPSFGGHSRLVFEYVELFGVTPLRMRSKKILRLLEEMGKLYQLEKFTYQKKVHQISRAGIIESLGVLCNKSFSSVLENHNYLKKVMMTISEKEQKTLSINQEKDLRKRELNHMSGVKDKKEDDEQLMTASEYKEMMGIESLVGLIGKKAGQKEQEKE